MFDIPCWIFIIQKTNKWKLNIQFKAYYSLFKKQINGN